MDVIDTVPWPCDTIRITGAPGTVSGMEKSVCLPQLGRQRGVVSGTPWGKGTCNPPCCTLMWSHPTEKMEDERGADWCVRGQPEWVGGWMWRPAAGHTLLHTQRHAVTHLLVQRAFRWIRPPSNPCMALVTVCTHKQTAGCPGLSVD